MIVYNNQLKRSRTSEEIVKNTFDWEVKFFWIIIVFLLLTGKIFFAESWPHIWRVIGRAIAERYHQRALPNQCNWHPDEARKVYKLPSAVTNSSINHLVDDLVNQSGPEPFSHSISYYLLTSEDGCQTTWHQDFSATSVLYFLLTGEKTFHWLHRQRKTVHYLTNGMNKIRMQGKSSQISENTF